MGCGISLGGKLLSFQTIPLVSPVQNFLSSPVPFGLPSGGVQSFIPSPVALDAGTGSRMSRPAPVASAFIHLVFPSLGIPTACAL